MKKVFMTKFGDDGDCLLACISTLYDIPIDEFPYIPDKSWMKYLNNFLITKGYILVQIDQEEDTVLDNVINWKNIKGYFIVCGFTDRTFDYTHAVIYKDGELWHDPMPGGNGIKSVNGIIFINKVNF